MTVLASRPHAIRRIGRCDRRAQRSGSGPPPLLIQVHGTQPAAVRMLSACVRLTAYSKFTALNAGVSCACKLVEPAAAKSLVFELTKRRFLRSGQEDASKLDLARL